MFKDGTEVYAECDMHDVAGPLVGDHESLDEIVTIRCDLTNKVLRLNAWHWSIEVADPQPAQ